MKSDIITVVNQENQIIITLNQPETLNAFSKEMIESLISVIRTLNIENYSKLLVLTGSGKAFSSGGNLEVMKNFAEQKQGKQYIESIVPFVNELIKEIIQFNGPTLAILNGSAVGGGFNLAMACDFRIVHERAKFRMGFIDIGLTPATGNSFFINRALGIPRTMALILLGETITAQNMIDWGLANDLYTDVTFQAVKNKWIDKIGSLDSWQVITVRKLLYAGLSNSYDQQIAMEYTKILEASGRPLFVNRVLTRFNEMTSKKNQ